MIFAVRINVLNSILVVLQSGDGADGVSCLVAKRAGKDAEGAGAVVLKEVQVTADIGVDTATTKLAVITRMVKLSRVNGKEKGIGRRRERE